MASVGGRLNPNVGLSVDAHYVALNVSKTEDGFDETPNTSVAGDLSASFFALMPTVRIFFPHVSREFLLGAGVGYTIATAERNNRTTTRTHPLDVKLTTGFAFYVSETASIGLSADMLYLVNEAGRAARKPE